MDFTLRPTIPAPFRGKSIDSSNDKQRQLKALRESTREFEALYVNEMFKAMRKTIPEGGLFEKNMTTDIFQEMMDMELARETAKADGIGLGLAMYNQMKGVIENKR